MLKKKKNSVPFCDWALDQLCLFHLICICKTHIVATHSPERTINGLMSTAGCEVSWGRPGRLPALWVKPDVILYTVSLESDTWATYFSAAQIYGTAGCMFLPLSHICFFAAKVWNEGIYFFCWVLCNLGRRTVAASCDLCQAAAGHMDAVKRHVCLSFKGKTCWKYIFYQVLLHTIRGICTLFDTFTF